MAASWTTSCIVLPKTLPRKDQDCLLLTKSMTIDYYTSPDMIDEAVDEMVQASHSKKTLGSMENRKVIHTDQASSWNRGET